MARKRYAKLKAFKDHPLHDWTSHAADAFGYALWRLAPVRRPERATMTGLVIRPEQYRPREESIVDMVF